MLTRPDASSKRARNRLQVTPGLCIIWHSIIERFSGDVKTICHAWIPPTLFLLEYTALISFVFSRSWKFGTSCVIPWPHYRIGLWILPKAYMRSPNSFIYISLPLLTKPVLYGRISSLHLNICDKLLPLRTNFDISGIWASRDAFSSLLQVSFPV